MTFESLRGLLILKYRTFPYSNFSYSKTPPFSVHRIRLRVFITFSSLYILSLHTKLQVIFTALTILRISIRSILRLKLLLLYLPLHSNTNQRIFNTSEQFVGLLLRCKSILCHSLLITYRNVMYSIDFELSLLLL